MGKFMAATTGLTVWLLAALLFAPPLYATTCSQNGMTRQIVIVYAHPGQDVPCEVVYEKPNRHNQIQTMTLWRADNEAGYCEQKAQEFAEKLQSLGWQCKDENTAQPPNISSHEEIFTEPSAADQPILETKVRSQS